MGEKKAEQLENGDVVERDGSKWEVIQVIDMTFEIKGPGESEPNRHITVLYQDPSDPDNTQQISYSPEEGVEVEN